MVRSLQLWPVVVDIPFVVFAISGSLEAQKKLNLENLYLAICPSMCRQIEMPGKLILAAKN